MKKLFIWIRNLYLPVRMLDPPLDSSSKAADMKIFIIVMSSIFLKIICK